jgi:RNA polymerase sigma-70 factor (ECF subfamily)
MTMVMPDSQPPTGVSDPDFDLVARLRGSDRSAFDELFRRHAATLSRLVRRYVRSDDEADDIAQRTFVRAYEKIQTFRGDSALRTWLFRIGINLALNHVRDGAADALPLEDDQAFARTIGTTQFTARELWAKVRTRLPELPPKQRLIFELRVFHDLSFEQVAAVAGCGEESAKANYHHALKRIRSFFSHES